MGVIFDLQFILDIGYLILLLFFSISIDYDHHHQAKYLESRIPRIF